MDEYRLKIFITAAQCLSLTQTASLLGITQSAVSKNIKELENLLAINLFDRASGRIKLTEAGRVMFKQANEVLNSYEVMKNAMSNLKTDSPAVIRIGTTSTFAAIHLSEIIRRVRVKFPLSKIELFSGNSHEIENMVVQKSIDIGYIENQSYNSDLIYKTVLEEDMVLSGNKNIGLDILNKDKISKGEIKQLPLIKYTGELSELQSNIERMLIRQEVNVDELAWCDEAFDLYTAYYLAKSNGGFFFTPYSFSKKITSEHNFLVENVVIKYKCHSVIHKKSNFVTCML